MTSRWRTIWRSASGWLLTIVGILVFSYGLGRLRAPELPSEAPSIVAHTLDGGVFRLGEHRGRTVVLNFWATWCGPCRFEIPAFSRFATRHPELTVVGVVSPEPLATVEQAAADLEIDYPVVLGTRPILTAYGIETFPTTVVVGPDGHILTAHAGLMLDPQLELAALGL